MVATFLKHGSNGALAFGVVALLTLAAVGKVELFVLWICVGALLFYLSEYTWHRFIFHAKPSRFPFIRRMQHRLHYDHHVEPARLDLLFLPLWFLGPNLAITSGLIYLVVGGVLLPSVLLGIVLAIFHYEWVHFVAHVPYEPRTRFGRWMKQYHLRHHFINEKLWFGVSNPSLDLVYRTYRSPKDVEKSATVRTLNP